MTEEWRTIPGHEGYQVSSLGRVRGVDRLVPTSYGSVRRQRGVLLRQEIYGPGYRRVGLAQRTSQVHALVLLAFVGPRPDGLQACHNDGDPGNNRVDNLRWDTPSSNIQDLIRHGRHNQLTKTRCPREHLLVEPNLVISTWRRHGYRDCRACARGRAYVHKHGGDLKARADLSYAELTEGVD